MLAAAAANSNFTRDSFFTEGGSFSWGEGDKYMGNQCWRSLSGCYAVAASARINFKVGKFFTGEETSVTPLVAAATGLETAAADLICSQRPSIGGNLIGMSH